MKARRIAGSVQDAHDLEGSGVRSIDDQELEHPPDEDRLICQILAAMADPRPPSKAPDLVKDGVEQRRSSLRTALHSDEVENLRQVDFR